MKLLLDTPEIGRIGVYGMGGIGKTTIMMKTNQHFNRIIWVTVSRKSGGIQEIQQKIAQELSEDFSVKLSKYDIVKRATELLRELKRIGKFLIILDDLWDKITLRDIGIPRPNKENNCKVLVTTRDIKVCHAIETQKNVKVKCLSDEEAWNLFAYKVGDANLANNNSELEVVAKLVVRECGGLPLAIVTLGSTMRGRENINVWENAFTNLKSSTATESHVDLDMEDKVFKFLRFSYDNLRSQVVQLCFLYCAFFPEGYEIPSKELIMYWIAEGYMEEEGTDDQYDKWNMETKMKKGFHILQELKDVCMLESIQIEDEERVRMHDIVRDLAIIIMREKFGFLPKAELQLKELSKNTWQNAKKISLIRNKMINFPEQLSCPDLSTLLLRQNDSAEFILPPCFFSQMLVLRVLDLSFCSCKELPTSLCNLANLRYLNLSNTEIQELPQGLGKLKNLIYLNLYKTRIQEVPQEMGALVRLRYLDLISTPLCNVSFDVISKLILLEDLRLPLHNLNSPNGARTIIQEMSYLNSLASLSLHISGYGDYLEVLKHVQWDLVKSFNIQLIDMHGSMDVGSALTNLVHLTQLTITNELSYFSLPKNTKWLDLWHCKIPPLSEFQCLKNLKLLKKLDLRKNLVSKDFLLRGEKMEVNELASLEHLSLYGMDEWRTLVEGKLPYGCLANLKVLHVRDCNYFKSLFSFQILSHFKNIEVIDVDFCDGIEEIAGHVDHEDDWQKLDLSVPTTKNFIVLPKLRELRLYCLQKLKSISRETTWVCDSLIELEVFACPQIEARLPLKKSSSASKCSIYGSKEWWNALQCHDAETKALFHFSGTCKNIITGGLAGLGVIEQNFTRQVNVP